VQFLPVFLAIGLGAAACEDWRWHDFGRRFVRLAGPIVVCALLLAVWGAARAAPTDFWTLGITNPGALRFIRPDEILPRLRRWLELLSYAVGFWPLLALAALAPLIVRPRQSRRALLTAIVAAGVLGTLLLYWIVASNTYDRYLHPLVPLVALLVSVSVVAVSRRLARRWRRVLPLVTVLLMLPWTAAALRGELSIGGDHGEHAEIRALAAAINALPEGSVVYDYWLGWELGFYLGLSSPARVEYRPSPEAFGRAVCEHGEPSYFVAPMGVEQRWLHEAEVHGAAVELVGGDRLRLYRLACWRNLTP
jgi:hypothetical protein